MERERSRGESGTVWILTVLSACLVGGVYLVLWAANRGLAPDAAISPYHLPAYLALAILLVWVVVAASRAVRVRPTRGATWPLDDRPLTVGLGAVVAYIVLDVLWREIAFIRPGIEAGVAPTRLLLAAGLALVAGAPLRMARRTAVDQGVGRAPVLGRLPAMISAGLVAAGLGFAILTLHPAATQWLERPVDSREDDSEIWVMQPDGSHQTRLLVAGDGVELSLPAWAPDGRQLAGTGWDITDPSRPVAYLWTAAAAGSGLRRITNGPGWQWVPAWSPAGDWIAYTASPVGPTAARPARAARPDPGLGPESGSPVSTGEDIWMVRPDGSGARALVASAGDDFSAAWSRDGRQLAFVSDREGNAEIYVAEADGTGPRRLTDDAGNDWAPTWSPDGRRVLFTSSRIGNDDVWAVNVDGTGLRQLTREPGSDAVPAWSPDGNRIAFVSDRTGDVEVWSMDADGGDLRNLTRNPSSNDGHWSVAWSPDGRAIAYAAAGLPPGIQLPVIREDLAVAGTILNALLVAGVAILAAGLGFGMIAVLLGISVGLPALAADDWRLAAAALVVGLLADLLIRVVPRRRRTPAVAALTGAVFAAVPVLTFGLDGTLYWSPTLAIGVVLLAAGAGWILGALAGSEGPAPGRQEMSVDRS